MANLLGLSGSQIRGLYRNKIEVYLEGPDDLSIYKYYWFRSLADKIEFKAAQDGIVPRPGCSGVEANVMEQRRAGVKAFGFVDRDFIQDLNHSNQIDDTDYFAENHRRNQFIYCTLRWELENYLVDPEVLERERVNEKGRGAGHRASDVVAAELVNLCEVLKAHAAANIVLHSTAKKQVADGFAINVHSRDVYETQVFASYLTTADKDAYQSSLARIEAFDSPSASPEVRLGSLIRRIHGKALLLKFLHTHNIKGERRFSIADKLCSKVPGELANQISNWLAH